MADSGFDIYFRGEVLPDHDLEAVKQKVAALFKADANKLAALFSGKVNVIKKGVDKATALKYQQAFKSAGAKVVITQARPAAAKSAQDPTPQTVSNQADPVAQSAASESTSDEGDWGVLPAGSDLLKPDERNNQPDVHVDTSAIKMVSPFAEPEVQEKPLPPAPDTSHISVAEVGADMNPDRPAPVADLELDLSDFSVAEPGAQLQDKKDKTEPPAPDTSHIHLA